MTFSRKARRELSWIVLFLGCLTFTYVLIFGDGGLVQLQKYRAQLQTLQLENRQLRERHHEYLNRIERLKTDSHEIERIARERYNFARPGDIIVNLPE